MKKTFTLILMLFMASNLFGQTRDEILEKHNIPESVYKYLNSTKPLSPREEFKQMKLYPLQWHKIAMEKSTKVTLDSIVSVYSDETSKQVFLYNNQYRLTSITFSELEETGWVAYLIMQYAYNAAGLMESAIMIFIEEGESIPFFKNVYTYDNAGNNILTEMFLFSEDKEGWTLLAKEENTFDGNGNMTISIYSFNLGGTWMASEKDEYTYESNRMIRHISYGWNFVDAWDPESKDEHTYNSAGKTTESVYFNYDEEKEDWVYLDKDIFEYSGNNLTRTTYLIWEGDAWVNEYKDESTFNSQNQLTQSIGYMWVDDAWVFSDKAEITYGSVQGELVWPDVWDIGIDHMIKGYKSYEWVDGAWVLDSESTFYWSGSSTTKVNDITKSLEYHLFPNPAAEWITITTEAETPFYQVHIYDISGRTVYQAEVQQHASVYVGHLKNGIYLLTIQTDNTIMTPKKLIIK